MHEQLRNMRPVVTYSSLPSNRYEGLKIVFTTRKGKMDSQEAKEQIRREGELNRVTYARESDIPRSPREPASKAETTITADVLIVPLVNKAARQYGEEKPVVPNMSTLFSMIPPMPMQMQMQMPMQMPYMQQTEQMMQMGWGGYPPPAAFLNTKKKIQIDPKTNKPVNYKTVPCKMFHSPQGCTRGDSCHFIHEVSFSGRPIPNLSEWKKSNEARQKSLKDAETAAQNAVPYYYTPTSDSSSQQFAPR